MFPLEILLHEKLLLTLGGYLRVSSLLTQDVSVGNNLFSDEI